ncbi:MAG: hypothetical protein AB1633_11760, partial [Elusimicrobiota bacterium]
LRKPTTQLEDERDKMKPTFDRYENDIIEFALFLVEAQADAKFRKTVDKLREDANYALATIRHIQARQKGKDIIQRHEQELREIEEEMKKLKGEQ